MKFLLWGVIIVAIVLWVLRAKKTLAAMQDQQRSKHEDALPSAEPMVECAQCGIHLPSSEAIPGRLGALYCSVEHRRLHDGT